MAIRIRVIDGAIVALCAAKTLQKKGDIYLDDAAHHALTTKFSVDFVKEGFLKVDLWDDKIKKLMLRTENVKAETNEDVTIYKCYPSREKAKTDAKPREVFIYYRDAYRLSLSLKDNLGNICDILKWDDSGDFNLDTVTLLLDALMMQYAERLCCDNCKSRLKSIASRPDLD